MGEARLASLASDNTQASSNAALLSAGFSLVYDNCSDFFRSEGRFQQRLSLFRDTTGVIVPVVTGALGLATNAGNAIAIVGLSGGAINSGLSVVAADFLFGAGNIDDVRTLTLNALSAHENTVTGLLQSNPTNTTFNWVANQIMDDQSICEGPHILSLAKNAIAKGNVVPYTTATSTGAAAPPAPAAAAAAAAGAAAHAGAAPAAAAGAAAGAAARAGAAPLPLQVPLREQPPTRVQHQLRLPRREPPRRRPLPQRRPLLEPLSRHAWASVSKIRPGFSREPTSRRRQR